MRFASSSERQAGRRAATASLVRLVVGLGFTLFLMGTVRNSSIWHTFFSERPGGVAATGAVSTTGAVSETVVVSETPAVVDGSSSAVSAEASPLDLPPDLLAEVEDDTFQVAEARSWGVLWQRVRSISVDQFARGSLGPVAYAQLKHQPQVYRGRVVTIDGMARRVRRVASPLQSKPGGTSDRPGGEPETEEFWEIWVEPRWGPASPMVLYVAELPPEFPVGESVTYPVQCDGYFYKRWAYRAQDGIRTAPLILARAPRGVARPLSADPSVFEPPRQHPGLERGGTPRAAPQDGVPARGLHTMSDWLGFSDTDWLDVDSDDERVRARLELRLLHELARVPESVWNAVAPASLDPASWGTGGAIQLEGEVLTLRRLQVPNDLALGLSFEHYFAGELRVDAGSQITFLVRDIPARWESRQDDLLKQPPGARLAGVWIAARSDRAGTRLVASRLQSAPRDPRPDWGISADHVRLAQHGLDVGTLDSVVDRSRLVASDRPAFYGLLAVTAQTERGGGGTPADWDLVQVLPTPEKFRGQVGRIAGTLRRAVRIVLDDRNLRERVGSDSYYQLDVFVRTARPIRFQLPDQTHRDFGTSYPVSICVPTLPAGIVEGEDLRIAVELPCIFLKLWSHDSDFMFRSVAADESVPARSPGAGQVQQWTPLFVGWPPQKVIAPDSSPLLRVGPGLYVVMVLIGLAMLGWYFETGRPAGSGRPNRSVGVRTPHENG